MRLAFSGSPEIHATRPEVWRRLLDPQFLGDSTPGVESVEILAPERFRMHMGFGVAMLRFHFDLDVGFHDILELESARMEARGAATGTSIAMTSRIRIEEIEVRRQRLHWEAETVVEGALAGIGARLVEGVARKLTERFWEDFADRVEREARRAG
ncbi:MAG TPA: SRPBCC domain-containing protein [Gemmatimonadales bacterium]|nr:SRPBCC domain-containing protein [Gemmatimonadales bacterium]